MSDPFAILGVTPDADDAVVRAAYLELVRQFPPEQAPERFTRIRAAYDCLCDRDARLSWRLFEAGRYDTLDAWIEANACKIPRPRPSLAGLLSAAGKR